MSLDNLRQEFEDRITAPELVEHLGCGGFEYQHMVADEFEKFGAKLVASVLEECLKELPEAVFIPDNATVEANALGVGLAEYRYKAQVLLINKLKEWEGKKVEQNGVHSE